MEVRAKRDKRSLDGRNGREEAAAEEVRCLFEIMNAQGDNLEKQMDRRKQAPGLHKPGAISNTGRDKINSRKCCCTVLYVAKALTMSAAVIRTGAQTFPFVIWEGGASRFSGLCHIERKQGKVSVPVTVSTHSDDTVVLF